MEKYNEATYNRPEGDRILDAPAVYIDLEDYYRQLKIEDAWKKNDRNGITVYKNDKITIVITCLHAGAAIENNILDYHLTIQVLSGLVEIHHSGRVIELSDNNMIAFHPGVEHSLVAREESSILITTVK